MGRHTNFVFAGIVNDEIIVAGHYVDESSARASLAALKVTNPEYSTLKVSRIRSLHELKHGKPSNHQRPHIEATTITEVNKRRIARAQKVILELTNDLDASNQEIAELSQ